MNKQEKGIRCEIKIKKKDDKVEFVSVTDTDGYSRDEIKCSSPDRLIFLPIGDYYKETKYCPLKDKVIYLRSINYTDTIRVGALTDLTGPTSDISKSYALGIAEAIYYVNKQGGINGKKIKLYQFDYGYRVPEALTKYKLFKRLKVVAVLGWGTVDTEALSSMVNKDKIPYVSAFYSSHLTDPKKTPYNLFFATDYSSNARAALTAWYDKKWPQHPDYGKRKPRLVASYHVAIPFCSAPIKALKDHAQLLGFDIGPDQNVTLFAIETKSQVLAMKDYGPDVVWHGNTTMSVAATIRDAYTLELGADHIVNNRGFDENLIRLAGKASEGVMGVAVNSLTGETDPMMAKVFEYATPGAPIEERLTQTIQAWSNVILLSEALKRADESGDLSGKNILKKGFETMNDFRIGLGAPHVTFTPADHRPSGTVQLYEIASGKFNFVTKVDLSARWPKKWANEWIGW